MKIKKTQLEVIIREEIDAFLLEVSRHDKPESVRKRELPWEVFPGYDDRNGGIKQLQNGIMEEEDLEEDCPGQRYHDRQGRWTDPKDDSGSWSIEENELLQRSIRPRSAPLNLAVVVRVVFVAKTRLLNGVLVLFRPLTKCS